MQHSEKIDKVVPAMFEIQKKLGPAPKKSDNPFFKSKYADLLTVWEHIHDTMFEHGLFIIQPGKESERGTLSLTTVVMHAESQQWISGTMTWTLDKASPQATGSCVTYARRYGLAAIFGLMTDKDDDAEGAMDRKKKTGEGAAPDTNRGDFAGF